MRKYLLILGVLAVILTGCHEETDLYFYANQKWTVETALTVDQAIIDLALSAGGVALGSELDIPIPGSLLQSDNWIDLSLDWMVSEYRNQGLDASWTQRSNTYTLIVKGDQFFELPGVSQGLIMLERVPGMDDQYHLQMQALEMGELDDLYALGLGYDRVVTLHAGKIVQSNATEVNGGTAIWRDPGLVDAVFMPANPFPSSILLAFVGLIGLVTTITVASKRLGGRPCPSCGRRVRKGQEICPSCGGDMSYIVNNFEN